jgi:hypothetical protein
VGDGIEADAVGGEVVAAMKRLAKISLLTTSSLALGGCYGNCGLTDDDVIRKAVEFYLEERQNGCGSVSENNQQIKICYRPYASYDEFIAVNSNCCRIEHLLPEYGKVPFLHGFWHNYRGTVYINSLLQRIEKDGSISLEDDDYRWSSPYDEIVPISSCGEPLMFLLED